MLSQQRSVNHLNRRNFIIRGGGGVLAAALGGVALSSCGTGDGGPAAGSSPAAGGSGSPAGEMSPLTFLSFLPLSSFTVFPEMYGELDGAFEKNGLDITLEPVKGSAQATQLLLAGNGQVARNGLIDGMMARFNEKQDIVMIAADTYSVGIRIITTDAAPEPKDWVGKTIGVPSVNGTSDKTVSMSLRQAGIDPESVNRQLVGLSPGSFQMVKDGTLAGYCVSSDTAFIVEKQNADARVFVPTTETGSNIYMSTKDQIEQNGDAIKKYLKTVEEVKNAVISADPDFGEFIDLMRTEYDFAALTDDEIATKSLANRADSWKDDETGAVGAPNLERLEAAYKELSDAGIVEKGQNVEDLVDESLLP